MKPSLSTPSCSNSAHRTGSLWTATFLHASHNIFLQAIFTTLTGDTGLTKHAIDEFGFVVPLVIVATAVWFWRKRTNAIIAFNEVQVSQKRIRDATLSVKSSRAC